MLVCDLSGCVIENVFRLVPGTLALECGMQADSCKAGQHRRGCDACAIMHISGPHGNSWCTRGMQRTSTIKLSAWKTQRQNAPHPSPPP